MNRDDFRSHPLWTYDYLMRGVENEIEARDRFRSDLNTRIFEASTFVVDDPEFAQFEVEKVRRVNDIDRVSASESGDFKALADLYAAENDDLRAALDAKSREFATLQQNVEALTIALRSGQAATAKSSTDEAPPQSIADAVEIARSTLQELMVFSDEVDKNLATLSPTAGPPDKVLRYFRTLGELSQALNSGVSLGKSIPIWLREKGVDCSGESETVKNNKGERRRRTFSIGGSKLYCEYHAKPSDGVSPDLCVRIYFTVSNEPPHIRVGYVGRHFE